MAFILVACNSIVSRFLQLQLDSLLLVAALRCMAQLTAVAVLLQHVLAVKNMWAVAGITLLLNTLSTFEIVVIKAKIRCRWMFPAVLVAMLVSTVPVSILGTHYAMHVVPFWAPGHYLPVMGMLCGNAITGISTSLSCMMKDLDAIRDDTTAVSDTLHPEAYRLLVVEALRLGLMPTINQMRCGSTRPQPTSAHSPVHRSQLLA